MKYFVMNNQNQEEHKEFLRLRKLFPELQHRLHIANIEDYQKKYFINPFHTGSKEFFAEVYDTFDGKSGSQHALLMTELGELVCALIDLEYVNQNFEPLGKHEEFSNLDNIPQDVATVAKKLSCEDHIREEIADVLMLLYQFAILGNVDFVKYFDDFKSKTLNISIDELKKELLYNVNSFDHQLNRQKRGRTDFSEKECEKLLCKAIAYANAVASFYDSLDRTELVDKFSWVEDDKAKSVQEWFDFKVQRTKDRMKTIKEKA